MLFPRKNVVERDITRHIDGDTASQSLLSSRRVSNEVPCFQEGYILQDRARHSQERQKNSTKTRKHHSAPPTTTAASSPSPRRSATTNGGSESSDMDQCTSMTRANTFPPARRAGRPKRLSLDHAAFMATFPMLDGLGDTSRPKERDYYYASPSSSPSPSHPRNTATKSNDHHRGSSSSPKPKLVRKKQSQEMSASRSSTSSLCSMVSDTSSSSSSPSLREPLTPTRSPKYYRTSRKSDESLNSKRNSHYNTHGTAKDLIVLHGFGEEGGKLSLSPKSNNFFDAEIPQLDGSQALAGHSVTGYNKAVVVGARGQRQLIAH